MTLVSCTPKNNKNVILVSSMHRDGKIHYRSGEMLKPEMITMYNFTKPGVDNVDEMCGTHSTSRKCR